MMSREEVASGEERLDFYRVLWRVLPHGAALAFATAGFGTIITFVSLFYADQHWSGAAFALTTFGLSFVACRLMFAGTIERYGDLKVAAVSIVLQSIGLLVLWSASRPMWALGGAALSGFGFGLIYPAIGAAAVKRVPAANRGSALGLYTMFLDVSLGLTGPTAALAANWFTSATPFLFGAIATAGSLLITIVLLCRHPACRTRSARRLAG